MYLNKIDIICNVNKLRNCYYKFDRVKCLIFICVLLFWYCKYIYNVKEKNMNCLFIWGGYGFFLRSIYWKCIRENMLELKFYFVRNKVNINMYCNMLE